MTISEEMAKLLRDKSDEVAAVMKWVAMEDILNNTDEGKRGGSGEASSFSTTVDVEASAKVPVGEVTTEEKDGGIAKSIIPKKLKSPPESLPPVYIPTPKSTGMLPPEMKKPSSTKFPFNPAGPSITPQASATILADIDPETMVMFKKFKNYNFIWNS